MLLTVVHAFGFLVLLLGHLLVQEGFRVAVDLGNLLLQTFVLLFPNGALLLPHDSLLITVLLLLDGSLPLVTLLLRQLFTHGNLGSVGHPLLTVLVLAELELALSLIFLDHLVFLLLVLVHLLQDAVSHSVHELLSTPLSSLSLVAAVLLLLIEHTGILFLHMNIFLTVFLLLGVLDFLILLVFFQHFVEVLLGLTLLLSGDLSLVLSLLLEALHNGDLVSKALLGLLPPFFFVLDDLLLTKLLLDGYLFLQSRCLVLFFLVKQLEMLLLLLVVLLSLLLGLDLLIFLSLALLV